MIKSVKKWFDINVPIANSGVSQSFELDKNIVAVTGILITSNYDDQLYFRGSQRLEINKEEIFPEGYASKLLMSGINVSPNARYYNPGEKLNPGNGIVKMEFKDTDDGRILFHPYKVTLYLDCEMDENK